MTHSASDACWLFCDSYCTPWRSQHPLLVGISVTTAVHLDTASIHCWLAFLWQVLYTMRQSASIAGWLFCDKYCTPWGSQLSLFVFLTVRPWLAFLWQMLLRTVNFYSWMPTSATYFHHLYFTMCWFFIFILDWHKCESVDWLVLGHLCLGSSLRPTDNEGEGSQPHYSRGRVLLSFMCLRSFWCDVGVWGHFGVM